MNPAWAKAISEELGMKLTPEQNKQMDEINAEAHRVHNMLSGHLREYYLQKDGTGGIPVPVAKVVAALFLANMMSYQDEPLTDMLMIVRLAERIVKGLRSGKVKARTHGENGEPFDAEKATRDALGKPDDE